VAATAHLNAINLSERPRPWKISFSYGRALQDLALATWLGKKDQARAAQRAYYLRAKCNAAAALGTYIPAMEDESVGEIVGGDHFDYQDD
jgi:fructose-bisphosphate aldolase class I